MYGALKSSTRIWTPPASITMSSARRLSSKAMPYCMPEQPPPLTKMRRASWGLPSFSRRSLRRAWASEVSETTACSITVGSLPAKFGRRLLVELTWRPDGPGGPGPWRRRHPLKVWPSRDLRITAIDAENGEFVVFKRDSGVELVDAVAASCAVPLVYPPATIGERRFIDGGMRSAANADLATGFDPIVALTPVGLALRRSRTAEGQIESLGKGIRSLVVKADAHSRKAIRTQFLDPALRASSARAGWTQATSVARAVAEVWASARP